MTETITYRASRRAQRIISMASLSLSNLIRNQDNPWSMHFMEPNRVSKPTRALQSVQGIATGKRCVILGTAPSIMEVDISRASKDYVMVLNKGYLLADRLGRLPDALAMSNPYAMREYGAEALDKDWRHVFLSEAVMAATSNPRDNVISFPQWEAPRMEDGFFQFQAGRPLYHSGSIAHSALQIAVIMGFKEVVLAGIDLSFESQDAHFYKSGKEEAKRTISVSQRNAKKND